MAVNINDNANQYQEGKLEQTDHHDDQMVEIETRLFKAALAVLFWIGCKENPKFLKKFDQSTSKIYKKLRRHRDLIDVLDKESIYEDFKHTAKENLIVDNRFSSSNLSDFIRRLIQKKDVDRFFKLLKPYIYEDKRVSTHEYEALRIIGKTFQIPIESIDEFIEKSKGKISNDHIVQHVRIRSRREKIMLPIAALFGVLILAFTAFGYYQFAKAKNAFEGFNLQQFIEENPKLVFKKVFFNKYIIYGKPPGTSKKFDKLYIFHASGYADFQFDLTNLIINTDKTDFLTKRLILSCSKDIPIEINVNIPQDQFNLIESLEAEPITEAEAKTLAKAAAVPAGIAGAYLGTKLGAGIGETLVKLPLVGRIGGGMIGGVLGGGAAAGTAYVMTKNFLTGLQLEKNTLGEQDQIPNAAKPLIALELMGGNLLTRDSWDQDIKKYYQSELEKTLYEIFNGHGWTTVEIEYKSNK